MIISPRPKKPVSSGRINYLFCYPGIFVHRILHNAIIIVKHDLIQLFYCRQFF